MYTATMLLPDGRQARLSMPDFYSMLTEIGEIPSPEIADVLQLLEGLSSAPRADLRTRLKASAEHYQRLYAVASACLEWPRLILIRRRCRGCGSVWDNGTRRCADCQRDDAETVAERSADEIGPRDLNFSTVRDIYLDFFLGPSALIVPAHADTDAGGLPAAAPDRNGVSHDAEPIPAAV